MRRGCPKGWQAFAKVVFWFRLLVKEAVVFCSFLEPLQNELCESIHVVVLASMVKRLMLHCVLHAGRYGKTHIFRTAKRRALSYETHCTVGLVTHGPSKFQNICLGLVGART